MFNALEVASSAGRALCLVKWRYLLAAAVALVVIYTLNASWLASPPPERWRFLAHRGVHQTFPPEGVDYFKTCTAQRIRPPTHRFLENTVPSMKAAVAAGADTIELDIHVSADGVPMVFHDAGLECRTNSGGAPEDHTAAELQRLDIGWGYTADAGRTFPFRGTGVGLMPTLDEVLTALAGHRLLIHFKTNRPSDGERVAERLARLSPTERALLSVYGDEPVYARVTARFPEVRGFDSPRIRSCLIRYELFGWTGFMPSACRHAVVAMPINYANKMWGWPRRFEARLRAVGSDVILLGPQARGIDDHTMLAEVPDDFGGLVWTNRIERLAAGNKQRRGGFADAHPPPGE